MRKYTEKIHRKRLAKMLQRKEPCGLCPAAPYFDSSTKPEKMWANDPCVICVKFIDKKRDYVQYCGWVGNLNCPCSYYGEEEAIERTIAALKKKGDL